MSSTEISVIPPLGLLYLAGYLSHQRPARDDVRLIDMRITTDEEYASLLKEFAPSVVGISTMTVEARAAHRLAATAKQLLPDCSVVMGGPHPTGYTAEVLADAAVDFVVLHEGEVSFAELLQQLESARDFAAVSGIAYRDQEGITRLNQPREYIKDLDMLPLPQWDLVDFSKYEKCKPMGLIGGHKVAPVFTSRACPYQCTYCHDMFGKRFQKRSVGHVVDEVQLLVEKYGVHHIEFVDDIFNLDRVRTRAILQNIIDRKLDVRLAFPNGLRGDLLTEDLIDLFARAGTDYVCIAVETASARLQKQIKKHLNFARVETAIRAFVERHVFTNCFYMLGFPSETLAEMRTTVDFACAQPNHTSQFFVVNPFKGTELSREIGAASDIPVENFSYHVNDVKINISGTVSDQQLHREVKRAYLKFFVSAARVRRILRDYPNHRYLWQMAILQLRRIMNDTLNAGARGAKLRKTGNRGELAAHAT